MSLSASCLSLNPHLFDWRRKLSLSVTRKYSSHAAGRLQREQERWHSERKHAQRRKRGNRLAFPQTSDLRFPPILVCGARPSAVMLYPGPEEAAWEPRARHHPSSFQGEERALSQEGQPESYVPGLAGQPFRLCSLGYRFCSGTERLFGFK